MRVANIQFSAANVKAILGLILTAMTDRPDTLNLMIHFLHSVGEGNLQYFS